MAPLIGSGWQLKLLELPTGWDNDGGFPITQNAVATIEQFATVPCSDGGIQLEIHRDGFSIEICVGADGRIESALVVAERLIDRR